MRAKVTLAVALWMLLLVAILFVSRIHEDRRRNPDYVPFLPLLESVPLPKVDESTLDPDTKELLGRLRLNDSRVSLHALLELTKDPESILRNLPLLLSVAPQATEKVDYKELSRVGLSQKVDVENRIMTFAILAHLGSTIHEIADTEAREKAACMMMSAVQNWVEEPSPTISTKIAFRTLNTVVLGENRSVRPKESSLIDTYVSLMFTYLRSDNPDVRRAAEGSLWSAMWVLPSRRQRMMDGMLKIKQEEDPNVKSLNMDTTYSMREWGSMNVSHELYEEINLKSAEQLLDEMLPRLHAKRGYADKEQVIDQLYLDAFEKKIKTSPLRKELIVRLFSDPQGLRQCSHRVSFVLPPDSAPAEEKKFIDDVFSMFEAQLELPASDARGREAILRYLWCAQRNVENGSYDVLTYTPYALKRYLDLLVRLSKSDDSKAADDALEILENAAWINKEVAEQVCDIAYTLDGSNTGVKRARSIAWRALENFGECESTGYGLVCDLLDGNSDEEALALTRLVREPSIVLENMGSLLRAVRLSRMKFSYRALLVYRCLPLAPLSQDDCSKLSDKGSVILMCMANAIRETHEKEDREAALSRLLPYIRNALAGQDASVPPRDALIVFFYTVFFPSDIVIVPEDGPIRDEVLETLSRLASSQDTVLRDTALHLMRTALRAVPNAAEIFEFPKDYAVSSVFEPFGKVAEAEYREAQNLYEDDLFDSVRLVPIDGEDFPLANMAALNGRLWQSENRYARTGETVVIALLSTPGIRERYWRSIVPSSLLDFTHRFETGIIPRFLDISRVELQNAKGDFKKSEWILRSLDRIVFPSTGLDILREAARTSTKPLVDIDYLSSAAAIYCHTLEYGDAESRHHAARSLTQARWVWGKVIQDCVYSCLEESVSKEQEMRAALNAAVEELKAEGQVPNGLSSDNPTGAPESRIGW
ncbi:MAG: hypothetical protein K1Y02_25970 [Candidatus Hydrogenedentes bacterium]|nr:hypothetical protein [Candidatus Hydrogenedentota bacterium]